MGPHGTWDVGGRWRAVGALNGEREGRGTHSVALRGQGGGGMRSEMEYEQLVEACKENWSQSLK